MSAERDEQRSEPGAVADESAVGTSAGERIRNQAFGTGVVVDPYPVFHEKRAQCPVHEGALAGWFPGAPEHNALGAAPTAAMAACSYDAVVAVLRDAEAFPSEQFYTGLSASIGKSLIGMDEPDHRRMRTLVQAAFSKPAMARWRDEIIGPIVAEHLDAVAPLGACDLQSAVGATVPVHTIATALGLPASEFSRFFDLGVEMTSPVVTQEQRLAAADALAEYVAPIVAERRAVPGDDLIGLLVSAHIPPDDEHAGLDDRPLSDEEIATFVRVLVVAGSATTYRAYGSLMFHLLRNPDQLAQVIADPALRPNAIEEAIRIDQPLALLGRIAIHDTVVEGVPVAAGTRVDLSAGAANHDPAVFDDPDRFDIHRDRLDRQVSFGFGVHRCLGIHLARTELDVMLDETLARLPNLRLDPDVAEPFISGLGIRVVNQLPVRYDTP
jgi:cytochrome P450